MCKVTFITKHSLICCSFDTAETVETHCICRFKTCILPTYLQSTHVIAPNISDRYFQILIFSLTPENAMQGPQWSFYQLPFQTETKHESQKSFLRLFFEMIKMAKWLFSWQIDNLALFSLCISFQKKVFAK